MSPYQEALTKITQLERQNADLRQQIKTEHAGVLAGVKLQRDMFEQRYEQKNQMCNTLMYERMQMVTELRSLQDDRIMLDWFDANNHYVEVDFPPDSHLTASSWAFYAPKDGQWNTVRNRLRAAMIEFNKPLTGGLFGNTDPEVNE
jgi:hypothetical protein